MFEFKSLSPYRISLAALLGALLLGAPLAAKADKSDQVRAREAMLSGEIAPLSDLLARVESLYAGEIIEVEMEEDEDLQWTPEGEAPILLYEIKLLTPQGNLVKLKFEARGLELLTVDGHDSESARKHKDKHAKDKNKNDD